MRPSFSSQRATTCAAIAMLAVAALSLLASAQSAPSASLTLVSTAWPPFTNEAGQPRFALDLVEEALRRVGISARTQIVSAADFTPALVGGKFDGSAAAWKDAEREAALMFSQPYLENRLVLVARHGADVAAKTLADLKGKRIAIVGGYSYGDATLNAGPVFVRTSSEEDSLAQLLKGSVDYTLMDELVVQYILKNYPKESGTRLQIGATPLVVRELYLAIHRSRANAASIIAGFNAQLRGMITDRTYHRLLHVDWISADITGDAIPEFVPVSDRAGPSEPTRIYRLFSQSQTAPQSGFYLGGTIYSDWASVPASYKSSSTSERPDPRRSTGTIFKFTW